MSRATKEVIQWTLLHEAMAQSKVALPFIARFEGVLTHDVDPTRFTTLFPALATDIAQSSSVTSIGSQPSQQQSSKSKKKSKSKRKRDMSHYFLVTAVSGPSSEFTVYPITTLSRYSDDQLGKILTRLSDTCHRRLLPLTDKARDMMRNPYSGQIMNFRPRLESPEDRAFLCVANAYITDTRVRHPR
jgi:hypothetical protein